MSKNNKKVDQVVKEVIRAGLRHVRGVRPNRAANYKN